MGRRWLSAIGFLLALTLSGCTYADREPGLFGRESESSTPEQSDPADPGLPVVGDAVWTAADETQLSVRIAVHAVRRIPGATVLDYSLTPLADRSHRPGAALASTVDLGLLSSQAGDPQIFLLAPQTRRLYRPLTRGIWHAAECLCTPIALIQQNLRVARTTLLEAVFPELPEDATTIDVDVASVPPFWNVPVTPAGMVPLVSGPDNLTRPVEVTGPAILTPSFRSNAGQEFVIGVDAVYAAATFTALAWTLRSVSAGPGLTRAAGPPFRENGVSRLGNGASAGAPTMQPAGQLAPLLRSRLVTAGSRVRCLCTDFSQPADALTEAGRQVSAVTVLPPLPPGTSAVDVNFPGAGVLTGIRTTPASDGAFRSAGPVRQPVGTWTESTGLPLGWSAADWPTPLPPAGSVRRYSPVVSDLVR